MPCHWPTGYLIVTGVGIMLGGAFLGYLGAMILTDFEAKERGRDHR